MRRSPSSGDVRAEKASRLEFLLLAVGLLIIFLCQLKNLLFKFFLSTHNIQMSYDYVSYNLWLIGT